MPYLPRFFGRRRIATVGAFVVGTAAVPALAHVHWTRTNTVDPLTIALYHFDTASGTVTPPADPLLENLGLHSTDPNLPVSITSDVPAAIFAPGALSLTQSQTLQTTATAKFLSAALTIEAYIKWPLDYSAGTLEVGLTSGPRILIQRDTAAPENDRFGIAGVGGSFIAPVGFPNWTEVGDGGALGSWYHFGLTIHSTGIQFDSTAQANVYSSGTVARLYLNGHPVGNYPHTIDISGLKVEDTSAVTIINSGSNMTVDEFTVWRKDWSENGANDEPFADGRGPAAAIGNWEDYTGL